MNGYVTCSHTYCFAIFIGKPGELCEDCRDADLGSPDGSYCNGCDSLNEE